MAYHTDFEVRTKALRVINNLIRWGDLEALLVVNFTGYVQTIVQLLWKDHLFPDEDPKSQFYQNFLGCLQNWAETYPTYEYLSQKDHSPHEKSPIWHFYRILRD